MRHWRAFNCGVSRSKKRTERLGRRLCSPAREPRAESAGRGWREPAREQAATLGWRKAKALIEGGSSTRGVAGLAAGDWRLAPGASRPPPPRCGNAAAAPRHRVPGRAPSHGGEACPAPSSYLHLWAFPPLMGGVAPPVRSTPGQGAASVSFLRSSTASKHCFGRAWFHPTEVHRSSQACHPLGQNPGPRPARVAGGSSAAPPPVGTRFPLDQCPSPAGVPGPLRRRRAPAGGAAGCGAPAVRGRCGAAAALHPLPPILRQTLAACGAPRTHQGGAFSSGADHHLRARMARGEESTSGSGSGQPPPAPRKSTAPSGMQIVKSLIAGGVAGGL
jgi:hypothetical protein